MSEKNKSEECGSCDLCRHVFEAKGTQGEEWAESIGITQGKFECPIWTDTKQACVPGLCCHDCRPIIAKAYDIGDSNGYARGMRDERAHAAQYKSQQPEPKPAMTVAEWWDAKRKNTCFTGDSFNESSCYQKGFCRVCPVKRAIANYLEQNVGCTITKEQ